MSIVFLKVYFSFKNKAKKDLEQKIFYSRRGKNQHIDFVSPYKFPSNFIMVNSPYTILRLKTK
jgi:hypothetical protein